MNSLPEKLGLKIPVNYSYSQTIEDPKYNPLNDDVEFNEDPKKDELKKVARTYTQQRSIGVLNMRKDRMNPNKKPKFYDVENLSISLIIMMISREMFILLKTITDNI